MIERGYLKKKNHSTLAGGILFFTIIISILSAFEIPLSHYISIISGFLLLFFLPGYFIEDLIFSEEKNPPIIRYIIIIFISTVVLTIVAILLSSLNIPLFNTKIILLSPLYLGTLFISISIFVTHEFLNSLISISLSTTPESDNRLLNNTQQFKTLFSNVDKFSLYLLAISITIIICGVFVISSTHQSAPVTEFFLLNDEGKIVDFTPITSSANETLRVMIGINNYEHTPMEYTLVIVQDNLTLSESHVSLYPNEKWKVYQSLPNIASPHHDKQRTEFRLYKNNDMSEPYRRLHIWIV